MRRNQRRGSTDSMASARKVEKDADKMDDISTNPNNGILSPVDEISLKAEEQPDDPFGNEDGAAVKCTWQTAPTNVYGG